MRSLGASLADLPLRIRDGHGDHVYLQLFNRLPSHLTGVLARRDCACTGTY